MLKMYVMLSKQKISIKIKFLFVSFTGIKGPESKLGASQDLSSLITTKVPDIH